MRLLVFVSVWLFPRQVSWLFGFDVESNRLLSYVGRLFAARDGLMGWGTLTSRGADQQRWVTGGLVVDSVDVAAAVLAIRRRDVNAWGAITTIAAAMTGVVLSSAVLLAEERKEPVT
jgi:hypothetical protein